jgi:hypothetical protein
MAVSASTFGWLDYSDAERRRMLEVVDLFREKGTLDELGLGTIRDTFAEYFFPGTSTIQTRARYFVFVPWLYLRLERERTPSSAIGSAARERQARLVQSLLAGGEGANRGVIGIDAGERLLRPPSVIYWQGLGRWGIRRFDGSIERYHASLDRFYREQRAAAASEGGELLEPARRNWHGSLPSEPADLLDRTSFALTADEAGFLAERIRHAARDSLLAACLSATVSGLRAKAPWDLGGLESLPPQLRDDIDAARRFSLVMEGAVLLYNLMLAERAAEQQISGGGGRVDRYRHELERWAGEVTGDGERLPAWDRSAFWARLRHLNPTLPPAAVRFSDAWMAAAIARPKDVPGDDVARRLIRDRELRLKGGLARLHNQRALERWSGASGLGRLTFRWRNAQTIVRDILDGLRRPAGAA